MKPVLPGLLTVTFRRLTWPSTDVILVANQVPNATSGARDRCMRQARFF